MRIAFDVHGVIDKYPEIICPMMALLKKMGNKICILSGPTEILIKKDLEEMKFFDVCPGIPSWTNIYSVVEFLRESGVFTWKDDKGDVWADEQSWWDSKAKICQKWEIDYMIDDSEKYRSAFDLIDCEFIHINELI